MTENSLVELNDVEQRVIGMLESTASVIEIILSKLSSASGGADAGGTASVDERTKGFIESVFMLQELLRSLLSGPDESYSYRTFERTIYGPLVDFACTADTVSLVSDRLEDLRVTLQGFLKTSQGAPVIQAASALSADAVMVDAS